MDAKHAYLTSKKNQLLFIRSKIHKAIEEGRVFVMHDDTLNPEIIAQLESDGYKVEKSRWFNMTTISWNQN